MNSQVLVPVSVAHGGLTRRDLLLAAGAACASATALASAAQLPLAVSLKDELAYALKKKHPLVIMVSLEGCPFCKIARQNYLGPMHEQEGLPVAQVDMRSSRALVNFRGARSSHDEMARSWRIRIAPTVLFFGPDGTEVAERLVGGYIPDFYGAYLDERLAQARASLK